MTIYELLLHARAQDCSDVHLSEGLPAAMRRFGALVPLDVPIAPEQTRPLILSLCDEARRAALENGHDLDFACETPAPGGGKNARYRVNIYRHRLGLGAAIRLLRGDIPSLEDLALPAAVKTLADKPNGLILVTGPTGSGKSTTLAAMLDYISRTRSAHILTVEDPVEYVFEQNRSLVHQREVGETVGSFAAALRSALREDPDIILVGEMRDYETISTAVTAAETGHLVLSTLHTTGAIQTIDRIVDTCPPQAQQQMRSQLSMILRGVVTQQLLPLAAGNGRVVATEILTGTDAVANLIRENKCHQLGSAMQSGISLGMHTMNSDLARLVGTHKITAEQAMAAAVDKRDLEQYFA